MLAADFCLAAAVLFSALDAVGGQGAPFATARGLCYSRRTRRYGACSCTCDATTDVCAGVGSCWPLVPIAHGEPDPAVIDTARHEAAADAVDPLAASVCQAAAQVRQAGGGFAEERGVAPAGLGSIELAAAGPALADVGSMAASASSSMAFGFALSHPGADSARELGDGYAPLLSRLAGKVATALSDASSGGQAAFMFNRTGPGNQHVYALRALKLTRGVTLEALRKAKGIDFKGELAALLERHLLPYASRRLFGGRRAAVYRLVVSRNVHLPQERARTRAMLWHWDGLKTLKLLVYLTPVPSNASGCMLVMTHRVSGHAYLMRRHAPWGADLQPSSVPRPWMRELLSGGYRPRCLTGPPGTVVAFNTNIVHRGSRPAPGMHRDGILLELSPTGAAAPPASRSGGSGRRGLRSPDEPRPANGQRALAAAHVGTAAAAASAPAASVPAALSGLPTTPTRAAPGSPLGLPMVGFGTANRRAAKGAPLVRSLRAFLRLGGGLIDTASMYGNYREIGQAVAEARRSDGVDRSRVWIVSKVNTNRHMKGFVNTAAGAERSVTEALSQLKLDTLDAMLIHLPWELTPDEQLAVWRGLIAAKAAGRVRHIGVSNFNRPQIESLAAASGVWPAVNEVEFHPWVDARTRELVRWCHQRGIVVIAYGSLGGSKHKNRSQPAIAHAAATHNATPVQILLQWAIQQGVVVIPGATSEQHIAENLALALRPAWRLSEDESRAIESAAPPKSFKRWKGLCTDGGGSACRPSV